MAVDTRWVRQFVNLFGSNAQRERWPRLLVALHPVLPPVLVARPRCLASALGALRCGARPIEHRRSRFGAATHTAQSLRRSRTHLWLGASLVWGVSSLPLS